MTCIPISPRFQSYLAIQSGDRVFTFIRLHFRLRLAPRVFTKLVKQALNTLLQQGIQILFYLDVWLFATDSSSRCIQDTLLVVNHITQLECKINIPKSCIIPSQQSIWIGLTWNLADQTGAQSPANTAKVRKKFFAVIHSQSML